MPTILFDFLLICGAAVRSMYSMILPAMQLICAMIMFRCRACFFSIILPAIIRRRDFCLTICAIFALSSFI